ncbi:MAG: ABC transporter permease subunit [Bacteroidales bacterium]|nr:ABC transporter permease subunit [Bacteroidales bacterium]
MRQIWVISKRELGSYFDSLLAYIMIIAFLGFSGFFTWLFGQDVFFRKEASLQSFFSVAYWTLFFFIPALTMRLIAEEKSSGTLELLLTKPVNDWQVVTGKFLSTLVLILIALGLTLPYYITIASIGPIDHGAVWTGYLGLILMSAAYISIGVFASSITTNQIVSFLLALFIGIFFHLLFGLLARNFSGMLGNVLNYLSVSTHYESISRGVIDSKDLIYFFTVIFLGLFASESVLAKRNVVD